jgi:hypothetical protein
MERGIIMNKKSKEQLLEELSAVQKMLEEKTGIHSHMIKNSSILLPMIDCIPKSWIFYLSHCYIYTAAYADHDK